MGTNKRRKVAASRAQTLKRQKYLVAEKAIERHFKKRLTYVTIEAPRHVQDTLLCVVAITDKESPGLKIAFADLKFLSKLLNTNNINIGDFYKSDGCETCDWGAVRTVNIYCRDCAI